MSDLEKALNHLSEQVARYRKLSFMEGEALNDCLKQITATLYYLETERSLAHEAFQDTMRQEIIGGSSVSRAENIAHAKHPEMYKLRRIMEASYEVVNALRSNISWIKQEINNTKNA